MFCSEFGLFLALIKLSVCRSSASQLFDKYEPRIKIAVTHPKEERLERRTIQSPVTKQLKISHLQVQPNGLKNTENIYHISKTSKPIE